MVRVADEKTCWHIQYDTIGSTNEEARHILATTNRRPPGMISAVQQTAGKGRAGRSWISPAGNLYCTLILSPHVAASQLPQLSFVAALALRKTIVTYLQDGVSCQYKWPNDVQVDGKKIAGILLERYNASTVLVGIGLNVAHHPELPDQQATHLNAYHAPKNPIKSQLSDILEALSVHMLEYQGQWEREGFSAIAQEWLKNVAGIGQKVKVRLAKQEDSGIFKTISPEGALILLLPDGQEKHITAGDVFFADSVLGESVACY